MYDLSFDAHLALRALRDCGRVCAPHKRAGYAELWGAGLANMLPSRHGSAVAYDFTLTDDGRFAARHLKPWSEQ